MNRFLKSTGVLCTAFAMALGLNLSAADDKTPATGKSVPAEAKSAASADTSAKQPAAEKKPARPRAKKAPKA